MEYLIGIAIWVFIFFYWYFKNYPDKFESLMPGVLDKLKQLTKKKNPVTSHKPLSKASSQDFKHYVSVIERICAKEQFSASDAATMVQAVQKLLEIEPASGQIWEAYALDSLETAKITCDDCKIPVNKTVKKTGIRIQCGKCLKWLALRNSKVMIIDPTRPDLEDWEK